MTTAEPIDPAGPADSTGPADPAGPTAPVHPSSPASPAPAGSPAALLGADLHAETVAHAARLNGVPQQEAERQVVECLRYLHLVSRYPEQLSGLFLPVEQHIDEVWHFLILQTREYRLLCEERLPGGFFIHHRSIGYADYQQEPGRAQAAEEALRWIPLYCREFGPFDEDALAHWTIVRFLHEQLDMPLQEISALEPAGAA